MRTVFENWILRCSCFDDNNNWNIDGKIQPLIKSNFIFHFYWSAKKFQGGGGGRKLSYHHQMVKIFFLFRKKLKGVNELLLVLYQAQEALSSFFFWQHQGDVTLKENIKGCCCCRRLRREATFSSLASIEVTWLHLLHAKVHKGEKRWRKKKRKK